MNASELLDSRKVYAACEVFANSWAASKDDARVMALQTLLDLLPGQTIPAWDAARLGKGVSIPTAPTLNDPLMLGKPSYHAGSDAAKGKDAVYDAKPKRSRRTRAEIAAGVKKGGLTKGLTKAEWDASTTPTVAETARIKAEDKANKSPDPEIARREAIEQVIKPNFGQGKIIWVNMERNGRRLPTADWEPALRGAGLNFAQMQTLVGEAANPVRPGQLGFMIE